MSSNTTTGRIRWSGKPMYAFVASRIERSQHDLEAWGYWYYQPRHGNERPVGKERHLSFPRSEVFVDWTHQ